MSELKPCICGHDQLKHMFDHRACVVEHCSCQHYRERAAHPAVEVLDELEVYLKAETSLPEDGYDMIILDKLHRLRAAKGV